MKTEKDGLDDLFKKGLADPVNEPAFREADWDAMEQMLDTPKKRSVIMFWLPIAGGIAAMLLVFLGYLYFKPEAVKPGKPEQMAVNPHNDPAPANPKKDNTGMSGGPTRQAADSSIRKDTAAHYANNPGTPQHGENSKSFFTLSGKGRRKTTGTKNSATEANAANSIAKNDRYKIVPSITTDQPVIANNTVTGTKNSDLANTQKDTNPANNLAVTGDHKNIGTADEKKNISTAYGTTNANTANNLAVAGDHKSAGTADDHKNVGTADAKQADKGALASSTLPSQTTPVDSNVKGLTRLGRTTYALTVIA